MKLSDLMKTLVWLFWKEISNCDVIDEFINIVI